MGEKEEREIQVRSLMGDSITLSLSESTTVHQLKLLLKQSFSPASSSPYFHLFLNGVKLSLGSPLSNYPTYPGDFFIFMPFTKKDQNKEQKSEEVTTASNVTSQCSSSNLADSAWSDLMQDLSCMQNTATVANQDDTDLQGLTSDNTPGFIRRHNVTRSSGTKWRTKAVSSEHEEIINSLIESILQSSSNEVFDSKNWEKFLLLSESINCLADPLSGICMLAKAFSKDGETGQYVSKDGLCLCPSWLKDLMKRFCFLNLYSEVLEIQGKRVTSSGLKGTLDQLTEFGFQIGISDLEELSVLCPKVVHFVDSETEGKKSSSVLVVIKSQPEISDQVIPTNPAAHKRMSLLKTVNAMKKRDDSFKTKLWSTIESFLRETGNDMAKCFSLEYILMFVEAKCTASNIKAKRPRSCTSAPSTSVSSKEVCHDTQPLLPVEMVEHLRMGIGSKGQIVHIEDIPGRKANYVEIPVEVSENVKSALRRVGITRLYSHQTESIKASLSGKNVVVATMTSSGKSLCYNLPVLEVLSQDVSACAFYLFPTKALAQDQLRALSEIAKEFSTNLNIGTYDGDTSQDDRLWLRDNARLLITNPDMLHMSILPFHGQFRRMLENLRFVIIDEAHAYKGAFGCHTALILRRLRRICAHVYGSSPSFVFSTATSANPCEHTMELANLSAVELIQNDGSPSGLKRFVLWNPPLSMKTVSKKSKSGTGTNKSSEKTVVLGRSSPIMEVSYLFAEIVQHGLRCIAFCKSRKLCELVLSYTREILQESAAHLVDSVCAYRAGYTAQDRRRIESEFFDGKLLGVAATNALELGIDVGHIDVTLHLGFPGSISSLWQQAGRAGRREKTSLAIYIAFEGPMDQYFMKFPEKLFKSPIECCHVDANNPQVLEQHLVCAAHEHPLSLLYDGKYFGPGLEDAVLTLTAKGNLSTDPSRKSSDKIWCYIGHEKTPSHAVSIRAIESERYKVMDEKNNEVLEEIEESKAFFQVYEGAVYMNQGKTYLIKKLDLSSKTALCQEADLKYYTQTRDHTDIHVAGGKLAYPARFRSGSFSKTSAQVHTCKVTTTWFGFRRIWKGSNQVFDTVELSLPDYSYNSQAVWIRVTQSVKTAVETEGYSFRGGLHAACHALMNVVPLYIICNSSDIASECANPYDTRYVPERVLLYDPHPGGTGISAQIQPLFTELMGAALELLTSCYCSGDAGCPNCVQSLSCQEYNEVLHKDAAVMIIKGILDEEKS
ncbi:uncharacterized protein LOC141713110 isoform X2 [Apium graveolens]|uniref:uncharacterized protein LOC141713110 isoform X2 n=1 Tax=Apium graveolens TaxID=4045 RepID=UPI003D795147